MKHTSIINLEAVFGEPMDGRPVTDDDIKALGRHIPIIRVCMSAHRFGHMTWEEALRTMVFNLAKADATKLNMITEHALVCTAPQLVTRPKE
jgi:hypothetical protein